MSQSVTRSCGRCGTRLARDNHGLMCWPCTRRSSGAPELPDEFWNAPELRAALAEREMGLVVRAYRYHEHHGGRPLAQTTVAEWLGITQGQLSRIESGQNQVRELDKLIQYARRLRIPDHLLWFDVPSTPPLPADPVSSIRLRGGTVIPASLPRADAELTHSLMATLSHYATTDNLVGPHALLDIVPRQVAFIERLLVDAGGGGRRDLLRVAARFAEFAGWLQQDAGDPQAALHWSATARDFAREAEDQQLIAYIDMRRSNIASDAGRPDLSLALARSGLAASGALPPSLKAVLLRQEAFAHAMRGDQPAASRALDDAFRNVTGGDAEPMELTAYCTPSYLEMEAANCWIQLGKPRHAVGTLERGLATWQPQFRRDLGLGMARLAVAYAQDDDFDHAVTVAEHAASIVSETRSARATKQLRAVQIRARERGALRHARRLQRTLTGIS